MDKINNSLNKSWFERKEEQERIGPEELERLQSCIEKLLQQSTSGTGAALQQVQKRHSTEARIPVHMQFPKEIVQRALKRKGAYAPVMTSDRGGVVLYNQGEDQGYGQFAFQRMCDGRYRYQGKDYPSLTAMIEGAQKEHWLLLELLPLSLLGSFSSSFEVEKCQELLGHPLAQAIVLGDRQKVDAYLRQFPAVLTQRSDHYPLYFYALALVANQSVLADKLLHSGLDYQPNGPFESRAAVQEVYTLIFSYGKFEQLEPFLFEKLSGAALIACLRGALQNSHEGHGSRLVKQIASHLPQELVFREAAKGGLDFCYYTETPFWDLPLSALKPWLKARPQDVGDVLKYHPEHANALVEWLDSCKLPIEPLLPYLDVSYLSVIEAMSQEQIATFCTTLRERDEQWMVRGAVHLRSGFEAIWPRLTSAERFAALQRVPQILLEGLLPAVMLYGTPKEADALIQRFGHALVDSFSSLHKSNLFSYRDSPAYLRLLERMVDGGYITDRTELLLYAFNTGAEEAAKILGKGCIIFCSKQAFALFHGVQKTRAPGLIAILRSQGVLNEKDAQGKTMLQLAVEDNDDLLITSLLEAGAVVGDREQLLGIARKQHCLTTYRILSPDRSLKGFDPEHHTPSQTQLWRCFLNSNFEDWLDYAKGASLDSKKEIMQRGAFIARFPAPCQQQEMVRIYGKEGVSYAEQQWNYAGKRIAAYQRLFQEAKTNTGVGLLQAYQKLVGRGASSGFRLAHKNDEMALTPIGDMSRVKRNRYQIFYPILVREWSRLHKQGGHTRVSSYEVRDQANGQKLTEIGDSFVGLIWSHVNPKDLLVIERKLGPQFQEILAMEVDQNNPRHIAALKKKIGLFYARASHAMLTERGNAQYALELHRLLYEVHGLEVGPPTRKVVLPDCYAISSTPQDFVEEYYEQCFIKFPESGDIVRPK